LTNAVILPYVMTFNRGAIADKSAVIARVLDLQAHSYEGFFDWVLEMRRDLGIPHSLAGIGVSADQAAIIGREAAIDPSAGGNPIPVDAAQLERIFRAAVAGDLAALDGGR
jgi:alcohol dehydrogenase class IV